MYIYLTSCFLNFTVDFFYIQAELLLQRRQHVKCKSENEIRETIGCVFKLFAMTQYYITLLVQTHLNNYKYDALIGLLINTLKGEQQIVTRSMQSILYSHIVIEILKS